MRWTKVRSHMMGAVRVQLYFLALAAVLASVSLVRAYDRAEHTLGELGLELLSGLDNLEQGVEQVELNGAAFSFAATALPSQPDALIAEFEARCARSQGSIEADLAPLVAEAKRQGHAIPSRDLARWLTRSERTTSGQSAHGSCFVRPSGEPSGSLWTRGKRLVETGNLGALGGFRYVRADRAEHGTLTRVLAVATDAALDVDAMLPETGDARGRDPEVTARPPASVRKFSARVVRSGQGAYVYESTLDRDALLRHYDTHGAGPGLAQVALGYDTLKHARAFASERGAVVLSVTEDDEKRVVTIFELGRLTPGGEK